MKFLWENATKLVNKEYLSVKICSRLYGVVVSATSGCVSSAKDSFITQDRNEDFEGGQVKSTFSQGHCDLTSGTISKKIGAK